MVSTSTGDMTSRCTMSAQQAPAVWLVVLGKDIANLWHTVKTAGLPISRPSCCRAIGYLSKMSNQDRADYLQQEICRLEGAIAHLENAGVEIYNNAPPSYFVNEEKEKRRERENYSPEIYQQSGEDILARLKDELVDYQSELAELERKTD